MRRLQLPKILSQKDLQNVIQHINLNRQIVMHYIKPMKLINLYKLFKNIKY